MESTRSRGPTATQSTTEIKFSGDEAERRRTFNEAVRRQRRKNYKDVERSFDAVMRAHGFTPTEIQTARAYAACHYEIEGQDYDKPVGIGLLLIGNILSLRGKSDQAKINTASDRASHLFTEAQPTLGYQAITRYKAHDDNGTKGHTYVDHITPVAELVAEVWAEKRAAILRDGGDRKQARIAESLEVLAADTVGLLPVCDTELLDEDGEVYAYLSDAEARDYSAKNPKFTAQPKKEKRKRQWFKGDLERLKARLKESALDMLDEAMFERGVGLPDTHAYSLVLEATLDDAFRSWRKTAHARWAEKRGEGEREELNHVVENVNEGVSDDAKPGAESEATHSRLPLISESATTNEDNNLIFDDFAVSDLSTRTNGGAGDVTETPINRPADELLEPESGAEPDDLGPDEWELETVPATVALVGSINYDSPLEAAVDAIREKFPVLPLCQFNPATGGCTAPWHKPDEKGRPCRGRRPLVAGDKSGGYAAATLDLDKVRWWYNDKFRDVDPGLGLRMDGRINIDADRGKGGLDSYEYLEGTYGLDRTRRQITQDRGTHNIFRLRPESRELLKSWTNALHKIQLPGIDIKVDTNGLTFAEPTRGPKGIYRWEDVTAEILELPHSVAVFFNKIRYTQTLEEKAKVEARAARAATSASPLPQSFNSDQAKFSVGVPNGDRHKWILSAGNAMWHAGASETEVVDGMRYHAARLGLNDDQWIVRTAASIAREVVR